MYAFYSPLCNMAQEAKQLANRLHAGNRPCPAAAAGSNLSATSLAAPEPALATKPRTSTNGSSSGQPGRLSLWHAMQSEFNRLWRQATNAGTAPTTAARLSVQEGYHAAVLHAQLASSTYVDGTEDMTGPERSLPLRARTPQPHSKAFLEDFVAPADEVEVNYAALLADLCDMAYDPARLSADDLMERHQLLLVTTSLHAPYGPITRDAWQAQATREQRRKARRAAQRQQQQAQADSDHSVNNGSLDDDASSSLAAMVAAGEAAVGADIAAAVQVQAVSPRKSHGAANLSKVAAAVAQAVLEEEAMRTLRGKPGQAYAEGSSSPRLTPSVSLVSLATLDESSSTDTPSSPRAAMEAAFPVLTFLPTSPQHGSAGQAVSDDLRDLDMALPAQQVAPTRGAAPTQQQQQQVQVPVVAHEAVSGGQGEPMSSQAAALTSSDQPPAAWFACDDPVTKIRYIVIQGSTTLEHWQINLQFEPVIFEDPVLGVRVHRGVYMAALKLYDELLPCVRQHLASSPFASVTFTGHSLGGSLATVLMLLMVSRGVLPADSVSPTYTFGAPAVFCGGAVRDAPTTRCNNCGLECPAAGSAAGTAADPPALSTSTPATTSPLGDLQLSAASAAVMAQSTEPPTPCKHARTKGLFAQLGLGEEHIVNVIMHRDIVPRAFACDYELVADLLLQWMPQLESMSWLGGADNSHPHKTLYNFLGRIAVLQPDPNCTFATPADAHHPHLPESPALYRMVAPAPKLKVHALHGSFDLTLPHQSSTSSVDDPTGSLSDDVGFLIPVSGQDGPTLKAPRTLKQAVAHFVNTPHPLTMLSEYASYGPNGAISRYHNPRNYALGLQSLVGKAPHQQLPPPSADTLPTELTPACPLPSATQVQGSGKQAAAMRELQALCMPGLQELAVSPEALRLVKQHQKDHSQEDAGVGVARLAHAKGARVGARARRIMRLGHRREAAGPEGVPLLGSLLSAVGYPVRQTK